MVHLIQEKRRPDGTWWCLSPDILNGVMENALVCPEREQLLFVLHHYIYPNPTNRNFTTLIENFFFFF